MEQLIAQIFISILFTGVWLTARYFMGFEVTVILALATIMAFLIMKLG